MKRLLLRGALFAIPFILLAAFVAVVDPFDCLGFSRVVSDPVKVATAEPLHNPLWKLAHYQRAPVSRLILGDSTMASVNPVDVQAVAGEPYFNFAYGGGTLAEAVDTYWIAAARTHLDAVYLGIDFVNFNEYQNLDRVPEARAMIASPLLYLTNRVVLEAAFMSAYAASTDTRLNLEAPPMSADAFWRFQLDESLPQVLHEYRYPSSITARLRQVAADCRQRGTRFVIVIPPAHVEAHAKIVELGRGADEARFKAFVATLGTVYDLDYANAFTAERANFTDPFHTVSDQTLIQEVWGKRARFSRRSSPP